MEAVIRFYRSIHRNRRAWLRRLAVVVSFLTLAAVGRATVVYGSTTITKRYVSPTGTDTNNNCLTPSNPCKTINHALFVAAPGDEIRPAAGTYAENILITKNIIIEGASLSSTVIDGSAAARVIAVSPGITATLSELTVRNGKLASGPGAGISNAGTLTLKQVIVTNNTSTGGTTANDNGGGIWNGGMLTIESSYISGNHADNNGGGIYNTTGNITGKLTVKNSVISGNTAGQNGGGIENQAAGTLNHTNISNNSAPNGGGLDNSTPGTLALSNVTISGNTGTTAGGGILQGSTNPLTLTNVTLRYNTVGAGAGGGLLSFTSATLTDVTFDSNLAGFGGGLDNSGGTLTLTNATFSNNRWDGLFNENLGGTIMLTNVTISGNFGQGIFNFAGTVKLKNTIVANSLYPWNCAGTLTDNGHNLDSGNTCGFSAANHDLINTDPLLGPLQNNGGYTDTLALLKGSPAINKGTNTGCPKTDQRGKIRITLTDPTCDIGAYEFP